MRAQVTTGEKTIGDRLRATSVFSVNHGNIFVHKAIARFAEHIAKRREQSH